MLTDIFFMVMGSLMYAFVAIFSVIDYVMPPQVESTIHYFFNYIYYFQGLFPIDALISAFGAFLYFLIFYYGLRIALSFANVIPFFNWRKDPTISRKVGKN